MKVEAGFGIRWVTQAGLTEGQLARFMKEVGGGVRTCVSRAAIWGRTLETQTGQREGPRADVSIRRPTEAAWEGPGRSEVETGLGIPSHGAQPLQRLCFSSE